jgi:hypothetical protein
MVNATRTARTVLLALVGLPAVAMATTPPARVAGPPMQTPARTLHPTEGYYDDSFSLDASGKHLAVIRTDSASFSKLELFDLSSAGSQPENTIDLGKSDQVPESIELLPDGKSILLVVRDTITDKLWASVIDQAGRPVAKTPLQAAFGRAEISNGKGGAEPALVGLEKRTGGPAVLGGDTDYSVAAFRLANLSPIGKPHSYRVGATKDLKGTDISVVGFYDGFTRILGQRAGTYDKKQDFRRPSRMVVFDTLAGKVASESEIEDVYAWTRTAKLRAEQPNRTAFTQVNQEHDGLEIIDPKGNKVPVALAVPFRLYDTATLKDQEGPEKSTVYLSIAVDPVNPDAIARQKTDMPSLDLYAVDLDSRKARHRVRFLMARPVLWKAGAGKLIVLKRFKSFPRGGDELDVYDLP